MQAEDIFRQHGVDPQAGMEALKQILQQATGGSGLGTGTIVSCGNCSGTGSDCGHLCRACGGVGKVRI